MVGSLSKKYSTPGNYPPSVSGGGASPTGQDIITKTDTPPKFALPPYHYKSSVFIGYTSGIFIKLSNSATEKLKETFEREYKVINMFS